jgi:hypothetical protein
MLINFTQKAIRELGIAKLLVDRADDGVALESAEHTWYCTDLEIYTNATAILLMHQQTWFSFPIVCGDYQPSQVEHLIRDGLWNTLRKYEVPGPQVQRFIEASSPMLFVKGDNNKRLLGVMNSKKASVQHLVDRERSEGKAEDWTKIMQRTNYMPCGGPNFIFPEEEFVKKYGGRKLGSEHFRARLQLLPREA